MKTSFNLCMIFLCVSLLAGNLKAQELSTKGENKDGQPLEKIRFGFFPITLGSINDNDATIAIRIWTESLTKELNIPAQPEVQVYSALWEMKRALLEKRVDVVYVTAPQWFLLRPLLDTDDLLGVQQSGNVKEAYVILVHHLSRIERIQDLEGKTIKVLNNVRTSLVWNWLSFFLSEQGLGGHEDFFKMVNAVKKPNDAVLPVFFKQADACIVTRSGFETMAELNPQIKRQLKILAVSPPFVPAIFAFRKDYHSSLKRIVLDDMPKMVKSSSGSQLLTIFQVDDVFQLSPKDLSDIISLLEKDKTDHIWKAFTEISQPKVPHVD